MKQKARQVERKRKREQGKIFSERDRDNLEYFRTRLKNDPSHDEASSLAENDLITLVHVVQRKKMVQSQMSRLFIELENGPIGLEHVLRHRMTQLRWSMAFKT